MTGWDRKDVRSKMDDGRSVDWETTKTTRKYLPKGTYWYDFWTGARLKGGQEVSLQTTFDRVPMFVRAGSILPLGPEMQYVGGQRKGNYPDMLQSRKFTIVLPDNTSKVVEYQGESITIKM